MEKYKVITRQASSEIRNIMSLDFELEELVTEGSITFEEVEEVAQTYNPKIHEACKHAPMNIIYDEKIKKINKIKNLDRIRKAVESTKAKGYILGFPVSFGALEDGEERIVVNFPVNFYKIRS